MRAREPDRYRTIGGTLVIRAGTPVPEACR